MAHWSKPKPDFSPTGTAEYCAKVGRRWYRPYSRDHIEACKRADERAKPKRTPRAYAVRYNPHVKTLGGLGWQTWSTHPTKDEARATVARNWPGKLPVGFKVKVEPIY